MEFLTDTRFLITLFTIFFVLALIKRVFNRVSPPKCPHCGTELLREKDSEDKYNGGFIEYCPKCEE